MAYVVKKIAALATRQIRHEVLRPNQPEEACIYPADEAVATAHFGTFVDDQLIGVASIYQENEAGEVDHISWRIRGMAVREPFQGYGYGAELLRACLIYAQKSGGKRVWCNARTNVLSFYSRHGFASIGDEFELPGIGPHYLMELQIANDEPELRN